MQETNKRGYTRVHAGVHARLKTSTSVLVEGHVQNLSLKGLYMTGYARLPVGTDCGVTLVLNGSEQLPPIELSGIVTRMDEGGVGIEFTGVDVDSLEPLRNLVMYNAEDADGIEREMEQTVGLKKRLHRHC